MLPGGLGLAWKALAGRVGKVWISLDSLVRFVTFQWVTVTNAAKKICARPGAGRGSGIGRRKGVRGQDFPSRQGSPGFCFSQENAGVGGEFAPPQDEGAGRMRGEMPNAPAEEPLPNVPHAEEPRRGVSKR